MPGLKIADVAGEAAFVFGNDILARHQHNPACIDAQGDMAPGKPGRNAISIAVILNQAGGEHPYRLLDISIESPTQRARLCLLISKNHINRAIPLLRMRTVCQFFAAQSQPVIQGIHIFKGGLGHKQTAPQELDLVLNLSLLPPGGRCAGNRLHHIVVHPSAGR